MFQGDGLHLDVQKQGKKKGKVIGEQEKQT